MIRYALLLLVTLAIAGFAVTQDTGPRATAAPGAVVFREPAYDLPHIYADTDLELVRETGREVAKDRLGQIIFLSRVGRGTLFQAFGILLPSTFGDDIEVREDGYTSSELNRMFENLPADVRVLLLEYTKGVNDTIEEVYAGTRAKPVEVALLQLLGLGDDLFGNATNISDQVDPFYLAPGGADPARPNAGSQFTPELVMSIAVLQVRSFGSESFGEVSRLNELNSLLDKFGSTGAEIWDDRNFLNDPLAPVTVPDSTTPGFGGALASRPQADMPALVSALPGSEDATLEIDQPTGHPDEFAPPYRAWPATGTTSLCPDSTTPPSRSGPMVAIRWALVSSRFMTRTESTPCPARKPWTNSMSARLERDDVVSKATRRAISSAAVMPWLSLSRARRPG